MKNIFFMKCLVVMTFILNSIFFCQCKKEKINDIIIEKIIFKTAQPTDICFFDKNIGFISGSFEASIGAAVIARTSNGGLTWTLFPLIIDNEPATIVRSISVISPDTLVATYSTPNNAGICVSGDSGITWKDLSDFSFVNKVSYTGLKFLNSNTGFVCNGNILKTKDRGTNWSTVYNNEGMFGVGNIFFKSDLVGYSYGSFITEGTAQSLILKSMDGGENWIEIKIKNECVTFLCFENEMEGLSFTNNNKIFRTIDGGQNWALIANLSQNGGSMYYSAATNDGIVVYSTGNSIYKTENGFKRISKIYTSLNPNSDLTIKTISPSEGVFFVLTSKHSIIKVELKE